MDVTVTERGKTRTVEGIFEVAIVPVVQHGEMVRVAVSLIHEDTLRHEQVFLHSADDCVNWHEE